MTKLKNYWACSLIVFFLITVIVFSILIFRIYDYSKIDEAQDADAIVVLGASQWNGDPSPVFKARLNHALYLYKNNYADKIILTGGTGKDAKISEAEAGKDYLINRGVDKDAFLMEKQGRTTLQSLKQVKSILESQKLSSLIFVSHDFHIMRAKNMCKDLGIRAFASPVASKNKLSKFKYVLREAVVYVLYLVFGV